jgi:hypothetical protein
MALCTRCGRQAEPGAEFCQGCAADAADQPMTAPAMAAAADYLRPFAAQGTSPALLPETHGPEYWTDPAIDRIPVYPEPARAAPSPSAEPPEEVPRPGDDEADVGRSYFRRDDQPYQGQAAGSPSDDFDSGSRNVVRPGGSYQPAPGPAFTVAGERYAPTASPPGRLQPYGPADNPEGANQQRYPIADPPYAAGQGLNTPAGQPYGAEPASDAPYAADEDPNTPARSPYAVSARGYPPTAERYPTVGDPAYPGDERPAPADGPGAGEAGYYAADQPYQPYEPYQASVGYPAPSTRWGATPPEDLTGEDPVRYPDPLLYPSTAGPAGPSDPAGAAPAPSDPGQPAGRGWGAGARRLLRRRSAADPEPDDGEQWPGAGLPGQPYAAAPYRPGGGPALAMAATDRAGPVSAGAGPAYASAFDLTNDPMLGADSDADLEPESGSGLITRRPPGQGRWIAFAAAAIVLIIASAVAAIVLMHRAPAAGHPASGPTTASTRAPAPKPTSSPLVAVVPGVASAPQAHAVEVFLTAYFTAINEHNFAAYQSLFSASQRGGLSAAAFARGYGSSRDSQATLRSITVPSAGKLIATVSFVSHQQPADSATHSSCTSWTISLFLIKQAGTYVIHTPPAGYGATAAACS